MGWFYGFKLHLVINDRDEFIQWMPTPGNVDDREPLKDATFTRKLFGKLLADRGYISQNLFEELFVDDIHLVIRIKKNMKNSLMSLHDKILPRKRLIKWSMKCIVMSQCNVNSTMESGIILHK